MRLAAAPRQAIARVALIERTAARMPSERWNDDRLDDLAHQVRVTVAMSAQLATHEAKIDGLAESMTRLRALIVDVRDENRASARASAWTPMVKAAVLGPTIASLIAAVSLVLAKSP